MSKVLHYYAKINESNICYGFETLARKFKTEELPSNLIPLIDYNESVLWRKWLGKDKGWSSETYEPEIDTILQDKVAQLETENINLKNEVTQLNSNISILEGTIMELTTIIANLQGGM